MPIVVDTVLVVVSYFQRVCLLVVMVTLPVIDHLYLTAAVFRLVVLRIILDFVLVVRLQIIKTLVAAYFPVVVLLFLRDCERFQDCE